MKLQFKLKIQIEQLNSLSTYCSWVCYL